MRIQADEILRVKQTMIAILSQHTGKPGEQIAKQPTFRLVGTVTEKDPCPGKRQAQLWPVCDQPLPGVGLCLSISCPRRK